MRDDSQIQMMLHQAAIAEHEGAMEKSRPSYLYRPALSIDGNKWCALHGENLQDGVAGFGDSPDAAYRDFDKAWYATLQSRQDTQDG